MRFINGTNEADLHSAFARWRKNPDNQRFGQYFWNYAGKLDESWPELWYEQDEGKAFSMIYEELQ